VKRIALACLAGCASPPPSWHVSDGFLRDPDGRAVILRGVNISGAQKSSPYLDDKQPADYAHVHDDWGMNAVRFIMTWSAIEPDQGSYDDAYLDAVAVRVGWANDAGLSVVLDMHEDIYGEGFGFDGAPTWTCDAAYYAAFVPQNPWYLNSVDPNVEACIDNFYMSKDIRSHFVAAWRHVAARLAKQPGVIGFDALNEPPWGSYPIFKFEHDRLTPLYTDVVAAVRAEAPHWIAFLEPGASRNTGIATGLTAFSFGNVMYAPHSYDANAEGGAGFDPTHRQAILDNVAALADEAHTLHAGLWIGEYGGSSSAPGIVDYMTAQYDAAGAAAAGTMYWADDKGGDYSLFDAAGNEKPVLVGVIVRPYPERVAGTPISYAFDASTTTFTLTYSPSRGETVLAIPPRVYPTGFTVDCDGCEYHADGNELVVDTPPAGNPATISIHP
jgi:endoglycosylceramidase